VIDRRTLCTALAAGAAGWPGLRASANDVDAQPDVSLPIGNDYFGMHIHRLVSKTGSPLTEWPGPVAIGALRLWDSGVRWADIEPQPGLWNFTLFDAYVDSAALHGASVLYTLGSTPRWASARPDEAGPYGPGCAAEPARMTDWIAYVRQVVSRYRGRIQAYELWNEPIFADIARDRGAPGFFSGRVATLVEMARHARAVIDELDPAAKLATPGLVNGVDRLQLFLDAGGALLVDAVAYHFYSDGTPRFVTQVDDVRRVMRRCGVASKPLWNTECGVDDGESPALLAQLLLLGAAQRVERFYYYAWDDEYTGMLAAGPSARARTAAYAQAQGWLQGTTVSPPERLPAGVLRIRARRGEERLAFLWAERESRLTQPAPTGWKLASVERLFEASRPMAPDEHAANRAATLKLSPLPLCVRWIAEA